MTGSDLANKLNISQQQVSRYERGINKFSVDMLFNITLILNVSFKDFINSIICEMEKSSSDDIEVLKKIFVAFDNTYFY